MGEDSWYNVFIKHSEVFMTSKKYNLNVRFFYNTLNRAEKKLYRHMVEKISKQEYEFSYDITSSFINYFKTYDAVINDFPEFFYADYNAIEWIEVGKLKLALKVNYSSEEIAKLNKGLDEIYRKFDRVTDNFELQEAVTEFICKEYTYSDKYRGKREEQEIHTVAGLLKKKKGVCSAFAKLAQYIFQKRGIQTVYTVGDGNDESIPEELRSHAWLMINHEGNYYHWDITAIMSDYKDEDTTQYADFNITDKEMLENYTYTDKVYESIVCDKTDYNYYHKKGLYFKTYEEMKEGITKFVKEMDYTKEVNWFNFRISPEIDTPDSINYTLSPQEINEILEGTGYVCAKFNTYFYRDGLGYYRCKVSTRKKMEMKLTVVQPKYYWENEPSKNVREFLKEQLLNVTEDEIIVLPEYSNAGGISDIEKEKNEMQYADEIKSYCKKIAKEKHAYVCVNVLEERKGEIKNSTYLYGKDGKTKFIYDKIHLPPSEVALGMSYGDGKCTCTVDGIRFAFMTCYDIYFNEQIEHIAKFKPDVIVVPGYQRGELSDIIKAQITLLAYRCNSFVLRSSFSMDKDHLGGCSMIANPMGKILANLGKDVGSVSQTVSIKEKCYRPNGFGGEFILNDDFVNNGLRPDAF